MQKVLLSPFKKIFIYLFRPNFDYILEENTINMPKHKMIKHNPNYISEQSGKKI